MAIQGSYPHYSLAGTSWVGRTAFHQPKCKCCSDDIAGELLELLVKRAAGRKVKGVHLTIDGLVAHFKKSGRDFSRQSLLGHMRKHITVEKISAAAKAGTTQPTPGSKRAVRELPVSERDQRLRDRVAAAETPAGDDDEPDLRGPHVVYLERVVRVAQHVVEEFPERVTPEMGIRAAAEIAKMRENDSREKLIDMLVASGVPRSHQASVGEPQVRRELEVAEEVIVDAVEVA